MTRRGRPPGAVTLTDDDRDLVRLVRAFRRYVLERTRPDPTLEERDDEEEQSLELAPDGGGRLRIRPGDPNATPFTVCTWADPAGGAAAVELACFDIEKRRSERRRDSGRAFAGDPRRGRRAPPPRVDALGIGDVVDVRLSTRTARGRVAGVDGDRVTVLCDEDRHALVRPRSAVTRVST